MSDSNSSKQDPKIKPNELNQKQVKSREEKNNRVHEQSEIQKDK